MFFCFFVLFFITATYTDKLVCYFWINYRCIQIHQSLHCMGKGKEVCESETCVFFGYMAKPANNCIIFFLGWALPALSTALPIDLRYSPCNVLLGLNAIPFSLPKKKNTSIPCDLLALCYIQSSTGLGFDWCHIDVKGP